MWALSNEPRLRGSPILAMMLTGGRTWGDTYKTFALGRDSPKADDSTDKFREFESDNGEGVQFADVI